MNTRVTNLTANLIAESMYAQCNPSNNRYVLLDSLQDHQCLDTALRLSDQTVVKMMDGLTRSKTPLAGKYATNGRTVHRPGRSFLTGFHPSWSSFVMFGNLFRYKPTTRRCVPIFYGNLRPVGAQTVWLLHFMLQMYATQKTSILNNNHPTKSNHGGAGHRSPV